MKFIGVDFGWSSGASGLCCLEWQHNTLEILDLTTILNIEDILNWIDCQASLSAPALIAVDAPTTRQAGLLGYCRVNSIFCRSGDGLFVS